LNDVICSPLEYSSSPVWPSSTYSVACVDFAARIDESKFSPISATMFRFLAACP